MRSSKSYTDVMLTVIAACLLVLTYFYFAMQVW